MKQNVQNEDLIRSYLLGDLSAEQRAEVEERYFRDAAFLEEINAVEDDLLADHALGLLSYEEETKINERLLASPYQQEKLLFTKTLLSSLDEWESDSKITKPDTEDSARPWFTVPTFLRPTRVALAISLVLCGAMAFWIWHLNRRLNGAMQRQAELQRANEELTNTVSQQRELIVKLSGGTESIEEPPPTESPRPNPEIVVFNLSPPTDRGGERPKVLPITPGIKELELRLAYDGERYPRYHAVLENADGQEVWSRGGLQSIRSGSKQTIRLVIPTSRLESKTYNLSLLDPLKSKTLQRYAFTISRIKS